MIEFGELTQGGREFTPTPPLAMEGAIRAAIVSAQKQPKGFAIIPYTRKFGEDPFYLVIRSDKVKDGSFRADSYSLDVGRFTTDYRMFLSVGMADFEIARKKGRKPLGYLNMDLRTFDPKEFYVQRTWEMEDAMDGLYVDEKFRGNGTGRSLITGARIILNELGIEELMLDHVLTDIYAKLGGRVIEVDGPGHRAAYIPTRNTPEAPYVFA